MADPSSASRNSRPDALGGAALGVDLGAELGLGPLPALSELDAPARPLRAATLAAMLLTVVASIGTVVSVGGDVRYVFASSMPTGLGDVRALDAAKLVPNTYVQLEGVPTLAHQVKYRRSATGAEYVVFPLAGQKLVFVEAKASDAEAADRVASAVFRGRLVTLGDLGGRYGEVSRYLSESMGLPVTTETFLLREGETPTDAAWSLGVLALAAALMVMNGVLFARWFRRS